MKMMKIAVASTQLNGWFDTRTSLFHPHSHLPLLLIACTIMHNKYPANAKNVSAVIL